MLAPLTPDQTVNYDHLFDSCIITPSHAADVDKLVPIIVNGKSRYQTVGGPLGIPWYFIGVVHMMEGSCNFHTHLHNGDPLTARTVHVPKGRPLMGEPPFSWEESANDSIILEGIDQWKDWSIAGTLYQLELYNGMGYNKRGIHSPYLWSFSNLYTMGKFTDDGVFDPTAVSKQCGAAVLLRRMAEQQIIIIGTTDRIAQIKQVGETVQFNEDSDPTPDATQLQTLLNAAGIPIKIDGLAGPKTSNAYFQVAGIFLNGDPRRV